MADEPQREKDETELLTLDQRITTPNPDQRKTDSIDINIQVTPGHDMVVNHLSGDQELGTGAEMNAVLEAENAGEGHTTVAEVQPVDNSVETPRTPDPETNGPDQQALKAAAPVEETPAEETPEVDEPAEEPAEVPAEPETPEEPAEVTQPDVNETDTPAQPEADEPAAPADEPTPEDVEGV